MIHRLDNSIILKVVTREGLVEREIVGKEIRKKKGIKGTSLKRTKIKVRNRIKDNLVNLVERRSSILIIFLPDFARRASVINI